MKVIPKKLLSVILALTTIISCVSVCFTAFAGTEDDNIYEVSVSAPAIPMTEGKSVKTSEIAVSFDGGTTSINGTDIVWQSEDESAVSVTSTGYINSWKTGAYKLTAYYGEYSTNVWAVVASEENAANNVYTLLEETFDDGTYDTEKWDVKVFQKDINDAYDLNADSTSTVNTALVNGGWLENDYYMQGYFVNATSFEQQEVTELPSSGAQSIIYNLTADSGDNAAGLYAWHFGSYIKAYTVSGADGNQEIHYYVPKRTADTLADAVSQKIVTAKAVAVSTTFDSAIPFFVLGGIGSNNDAVLNGNGEVAYKADAVTPVYSSEWFYGTGFFYSTDEIFNDFADYTIKTSVALIERGSHRPGGNATLDNARLGAAARITYDDTRVNNFVGVVSGHRLSGGDSVYMGYASDTTKKTSVGVYGTWSTLAPRVHKVNQSLSDTTEWDKTNHTSFTVDTSITLSGNQMITNSIATQSGTAVISESVTSEISVENKGTVGVVVQNSGGPAVDAITVTLNTDILENKPAVYDMPIYKISYDSPVLPMLINTKTNIDSLAVQLTADGEYTLGKNLVWEVAKNECGLYMDYASGDIMAYGTGYAYITVSDGNNELEIAVSVAETGNGAFNIFEYDFADWTADVAAGTCPFGMVKCVSNDHSELDITTAVTYNSSYGIYSSSSGSGRILYVKDCGALKNFSNYTVSYTGSTNQDYLPWRRIGVAGRIVLDSESGIITTSSDMLVAAISYNGATSSQINFSIKNAAPLYSHGNYLMRNFNYNTDTVILKDTSYDFAYKFNGNDVAVYAAPEGEELKQIYSLADDTEYSSLSQVKSNLYTGAGTVGIVFHDTHMRARKFSVSVEVESLPVLTEIEGIYNISKASPALPIVVKNKVNTCAVAVQLTDGGEYINGRELVWSVISDTDGLVYESAAGDIYAYETGKYIMQVTDGINTTQIAVIVDETKDSAFYLLEYDFADLADDLDNGTNKWKVQSVAKYNEITFTSASSFMGYNTTIGGAYFNTDGDSHVLYYGDDTVLKHFSDYTVNFTAANTRDMVSWRRLGAVGRISLNSSSLIDSTTPYIAATINMDATANNMNFMITGNTHLNNSDWYPFQSMQIDSAFITEKSVMYDYSYQFSGKDIIVYAAKTGEELQKLYTLSQETQSGMADCVENRLPTNGGTVGFYGSDAWSYIRSVYVSAGITTLPNSSPIVATEATDNTVYATVNHYMDLADVSFNMGSGAVSGDKLSWTTVRTPNYEINADTDEFAAYQNGTFTETVIYNGQEHIVTFVITDDTEVVKPRELPLITVIGDAAAVIKPTDGSDTEYTLTLSGGAGYKLKVNSLTNNGTVISQNFDSTGRVYGFTATTPSEIGLTVEFIEDNGQYNSVMLGATLNYSKSGIRFGSRTDLIKKSPNASVGYLDDKILVDGTVYAPIDIGMLLVPSVLLDGELTADSKYVQKVSVKSVVNLTEEYSDIAISLTNIPDTMYDTDISSCMYVAYEEDGVTKYIYGQVIERSFNGINDSIMSEIIPAGIKVTGSTEYDLDDDASTNSATYKYDDTITFKIETLYNDTPISGVKLKWNIYQDGYATGIASYSPVASGEAMSVAGDPLEISYKPSDSDLLDAQEGGLVYLTVTPCNSNGTAYSSAKKFQGGAIYNADAINAALAKETDFDTFWKTQAADVEAFFTDEVKKDLSVSISELESGYVLKYANGDKISIKPANSSVSGYSSMSTDYYCYEVRIEYGSSTGRAASGFLAIPKTGTTYKKGIGFAGYNTGSAAGIWSYENYAYINSEAHGIAFDDEETSRKNYNSTYNEPNFLFNYDDMTEEQLADINMAETEFYHMYIRNLYMTRLLHYLNIESLTYQGTFTALGGSMGGMQNIVNTGLDAMCGEQAITGVSINLAAWCVDMGGYTEGRLASWHPQSNWVTNMADPIHFATYIKNVSFSVDMGLGDLTSPPTGIVALYNELKDNTGVKVSMKVNQNKTHGASDSLAPTFTVQNY